MDYFKSFHIYGKKQPPLLLWFRWSASLLFEDIFFHHNLAGDLPPLGSRPPPLPQLSPRVRQSPPSPGEEGLAPSVPNAHLETGQYKARQCLEAAQWKQPYTIGPSWGGKRGGGETKKIRHCVPRASAIVLCAMQDFKFVRKLSTLSPRLW